MRLSVVKPDETNDSIQNQKDIIEDYLSARSDIVLTDFCIDGNTGGSSFERKALDKLLGDISQGRIDCVVIKDACVKSRLKIHIEYLELSCGDFFAACSHKMCLRVNLHNSTQ